MKYIDEFRDGKMARALARTIEREVKSDRHYHLMEFCGGHTHAISRYGLEDLLPKQINMIHGPGCPVCVLPIGRIDSAIRLALENNITLCTYADTLRIPASEGLSLFRAKALGADVRMVYSSSDALRIAQDNPEREVVFFAIGFETTTPPTAVAIKQAAALKLENFSVFCCHVLTPAAMVHLMERSADSASESVQIDGFVGPSHVSMII
ncbi:MAG: hydrogenase formation protein HypD, partial [Burkholderiaceae bacterium]|nr:hydrogenase formation protein HypD [Burkholderiaceae bacterium]